MPSKRTTKKAQQDRREGKSASTQAGEYVHEEIEHVRSGKHGARSAKQAIAIGLSKARKAGVRVPKKRGASASSGSAKKTGGRKGTARRKSSESSTTRARAASKALKREGRSAASHRALSRHAKTAARRRPAAARSASAKKAARTRKHR
jgi:hypothetical protein